MTYRQLLAANADFRRLWMGQVVSEIGDWLNNIAVLALAIQLAGEGEILSPAEDGRPIDADLRGDLLVAEPLQQKRDGVSLAFA